MPLRQSRLNFDNTTTRPPKSAVPMATGSHRFNTDLSPDPELDPDTIVVKFPSLIPQFPTPSESVTDMSSQRSHEEDVRLPSKAAPRRVVPGRKSRFREETLVSSAPAADEKHRSISGETLVASASLTTVLKDGVKVLDSDWTMKVSTLVTGDAMEVDTAVATDCSILKQGTPESEDSSIQVVASIDEKGGAAEKASREAAQRKLKMEENARKWEIRKKAAEKNATRRSDRASLTTQAKNKIAEIASTVLGKRSRDNTSATKKTHASQDTKDRSQDTSEPEQKKPRLDDDTKAKPVGAPVRREKKWLVKGLYAGQARTFDARFSESSNKKKSTPKQGEELSKENSILPLPMFAGERLLKHGRDFKLPFDIYCPPPPGQPKPPNWKKLNKNVLIDDACDLWRFDRNMESSRCLCDWKTGCGHNCLNRMMYYECDRTNCNAGAECGNRQWAYLFRRKEMNSAYSIGVDVVKTADRGFGVRASREFAPGELILEYTGEVITQEECESRMRTIYKDNECYYLMVFEQNMIIDATKGSMARFVNHSCEPNSRMEKWNVQGCPRMALFAGDNGVLTGEELTYDYNFDPYSSKNIQQCRCGAAKCRGFLVAKPKDVKQKSPEEDEHGKKSGSRVGGAKRKMAEAVDERPRKLTKKSKSQPAKSATKGKTAKTKSPSKVIVKKVTAKKVKVTKSPRKIDSKLQKIVNNAKSRTVTAKSKRVVSSVSMKEPLLKKVSTKSKAATKGSKPFKASSSLREKASALKENVVKSVRGKSK